MGLKKRLLSIGTIACVLAGACFVGLSGMQVKQQAQESAFDLHKKETIYFWYTDSSMTDYLGSAAVAFSEKNDVRVIPRLVSASEYLEAINEASLAGEQMPDAYLLSNDSLGKAYLAGLAAVIDDQTDLCNIDNFPQTALSAVSYKDHPVAYPYYYETSAFLYNKTYLEAWTAAQLAAGVTGEDAETGIEFPDESYGDDEFIDEGISDGELTAEEDTLNITQEQLEAGIPANMDELLAFADNYDASENGEAIFKWDVSDIFYNYQFVGEYMEVGGESGDDEGRINIYNEETKKCLQVYQALNQFFYIDADEVSYDSVLQEFIEGKLVFTIVMPDAVEVLEQAKADGSFAYEYGIATIPKPSAELGGRALSVTNCVVVNGYSEHKELANRFAAFLTGEYLDNLYSRTGKLAANRFVNTDNPNLMAFMQEYENSISLPKMIQTSNFWMQLEIVFAKVWSGADADTLLQELMRQIISQIE